MSIRRAAFNASLSGSEANRQSKAAAESPRGDLPPGLSHPRAHAHVTNSEVEQAAATASRQGGRGKGGVGRGEAARKTTTGVAADEGQLEQATAGLSVADAPTTSDEAPPSASADGSSSEDQQVADAETCFICAEPIIYYAVGVCGHRTCQ